MALKDRGLGKTSRTHEYLGCTYGEFAIHIESLFKDGMNWTNRHLWQLDHIEPISRAVTEEDVRRLSHYTNLQPLWAEDNNRKSNKYEALDNRFVA